MKIPDPPMRTELPLIYSCSGCSNVAQLANRVAVDLDREGVAEMSCIAGVGGDVESLVKVARSERKIVVLDGCPLECARKCLARHGVIPDAHMVITSCLKVSKRKHEDCFPDDVGKMRQLVKLQL
jgi:uncharacterized metal-binding protein